MLRASKSTLSSVAQIGARSMTRASLTSVSCGALLSAARPALAAPRLGQCAQSWAQLRHYTPPASSKRVVDEPARVIDYNEMKKLVATHDANTVIVDVREPSEYEQGHIGDAVNIPFKSMPGALGLDPVEFDETLGFEKPSTDKTLVFYCLGGVRSSSAEQLASTYGYQHRMNYMGSYGDWQQQEAQHAGKA